MVCVPNISVHLHTIIEGRYDVEINPEHIYKLL